MKKKWYCYICGEKLLKCYYLVTMRESTDRVFLCCKKDRCMKNIKTKEFIAIEVREEI